MNSQFDESKHKRDKDGKFSSMGGGGGSSGTARTTTGSEGTMPTISGLLSSGRGGGSRRRSSPQSGMTQKDRADWERTGKETNVKLTPAVKKVFANHFARLAKIEAKEKRMREFGTLKEGQHTQEWHALSRETLEAVRQSKHERREAIEARPQKRKDQRYRRKLERKLWDLENHLDYLEESYADRDSGAIDQLKFPDEEAEAEYEELRKKRDELEAELDALGK